LFFISPQITQMNCARDRICYQRDMADGKIIGMLLAVLAMGLFNISPVLQKSAQNDLPRLSFLIVEICETVD